MRAVVHWLRSAVIVAGLCALPCGQAVTPPMLPDGSGMARSEAAADGFSHPHLQPGKVAAGGSAPLDGNSLLALVLAALGMAALAAARAPVKREATASTAANEPNERVGS